MFDNLTTPQLVAKMRRYDRDAAIGLGVHARERDLRWLWHELDRRLSADPAQAALVWFSNARKEG